MPQSIHKIPEYAHPEDKPFIRIERSCKVVLGKGKAIKINGVQVLQPHIRGKAPDAKMQERCNIGLIGYPDAVLREKLAGKR